MLTDPLLGPNLGPLLRRGPAPDTAALAAADAVLVSHMHHDHLDVRSLRRLGRPVVAPAGAAKLLRKRGLPVLAGLSRGEATSVGDLRVTAVHAEHAGGRFGHGSGESDAIGYLIDGETSVYFAGDTELFDSMADLAGRVDVALVPIWGWGPTLGPGHLNPETAAEALALIRPRIAVPIHWGTLSLPGSSRLWPWLLSEPAERFEAAAAERAPDVEVRVLAPGERTELP